MSNEHSKIVQRKRDERKLILNSRLKDKLKSFVKLSIQMTRKETNERFQSIFLFVVRFIFFFDVIRDHMMI